MTRLTITLDVAFGKDAEEPERPGGDVVRQHRAQTTRRRAAETRAVGFGRPTWSDE